MKHIRSLTFLVALFAIITDICFAHLENRLRWGATADSANKIDQDAENEDRDAAPQQ